MRTLVLALSLSLLAVPSSALAVSSKRTKKKVVHKKHHWVRRVLAHFAPVPVRVRQAAFTEVSGRMEERTAGFENPAALVPLFERLYRLQQNPGPLHILHYGDSHTASDDWANTLRTSLQAKFGVGGPGFLQPGHPFRGYRRFDAKSSSSSGWLTEGLAGHPGDGRYGLVPYEQFG